MSTSFFFPDNTNILDFMYSQNLHQSFNLNTIQNQNISNFLNEKKEINDKNQPINLLDENQFNQKKNCKNTYIKKINELVKQKSYGNLQKFMKIESEITVKGEETEKCQKGKKINRIQSSIEIDGKNFERLQKNRESARNSRKRKKVYIEMLEKRVNQLNEDLNNKKLLVLENEKKMSELSHQNKFLDILPTQSKDILMNMEENLNNNTNNNEKTLNLIDSLKKTSIFNIEAKKNNINFFTNQILENMVPTHVSYFLSLTNDENSFTNQLDIFQNTDISEKTSKDFNKFKKRICFEKEKLGEIIRKIYHLKSNFKKNLSIFQKTFNEFEKIMEPAQLSKFLISLNKIQNHDPLDNEENFFKSDDFCFKNEEFS